MGVERPPWPCPTCRADVLAEVMNGHDCPACGMKFKDMMEVTLAPLDPNIIIRLPLSHWRQIVSDIENMCGLDESEIEILQGVEMLDGPDAT